MACLIGGSFLFLNPLIGWTAKITDVRFWTAPDHTRVVFDLTEPLQYENPSQESSTRTQLDLKGVSLQVSIREVTVNDPFVTRFTLSDPGKGRVSIVFYQKKPLTVDVFALKP